MIEHHTHVICCQQVNHKRELLKERAPKKYDDEPLIQGEEEEESWLIMQMDGWACYELF